MNERQHTELPAWQKSMQLLKQLYALTATFPNGEKDGLGQTIKTRMTEVPVAIALALGNGLQAGSANHLQKAYESITVVDSLLQITLHLGLIKDVVLEPIQDELIDIQKELLTLGKRVEKKKR